ncbi:TPA: DUF3850 domain-containing protein [Enterococcus faecalis]|nr:DUF3850 domain-containing protein [Enterococcus faecalis]DAR19540.1 MAG TPA: activating signal cointegrator [Caudoviricetes sp.]MBT2156414.1 ASCH domain-containing protein [Enterococcus faecalis]MCD4869781.1 DUF3850 domain-containing protein [Enterococcus faecalis]MCD4923501.1 DUF3850 domain-containing protein [Enterococcus faecalis]
MVHLNMSGKIYLRIYLKLPTILRLLVISTRIVSYWRDRNEFWYENEDNDRVHHLKILPEYFEAVVSGDKCFEIRKNDRGYKVGDILRLNEYEDGKYTGNFHVAEITYITDYAQQDGYVVLGIK